MAPTSLETTYKLNSGYEIPVVGFGVSIYHPFRIETAIPNNGSFHFHRFIKRMFPYSPQLGGPPGLGLLNIYPNALPARLM